MADALLGMLQGDEHKSFTFATRVLLDRNTSYRPLEPFDPPCSVVPERLLYEKEHAPELFKDFCRWRRRVSTMESLNSVRLRMVLWAYDQCVSMRQAYGEQFDVALATIEGFSRTVWKIDPTTPRLPNLRAFCEHATRRHDVLPPKSRSV